MFRTRVAFSKLAVPAGLILAGCSPQSFSTPLENAEGDHLTSHPEMLAFLEHLQEDTDAFTLDPIGTSVEGRGLVLLHFRGRADGAVPSAEKLKVLIFAQQHGNEPSGKEAAITLARDIATGAFAGFLEHIDFYLIPQVNPDGSEARQRENAEGMDLNRDHLTLDTPEVQAVHRVFRDVMPEVVLDVHEYGITSRAWLEMGVRKDFGQQIGALSNPNMSLRLRSYAWNRVIPEMADALAPKGVSLNRYLVSDGPDARFRYSTTALNDGRNSTGIYNALTFLIEGRNGLTMEDNIRERARQQLETMKAFLGFFDENAREVRELVHAEQAVLAGDDPPPEVALVMDYVPDPERPAVTVGVVDADTGEKRSMVIEDFQPRVEATLLVQRPRGYVIPPDLTPVIGVLERHGVPMTPLDTALTLELAGYRIRGTTVGEKEDKEFLDVDVSSNRGVRTVPAGHILVQARGIQTNLIVSLLEPQSQWGLAPLPQFAALLEVGREYPILRIPQGLD
ncbi:MAG: M14 family zinc carboxypeptidase [Gemmatimonadota bacterium]|jgi:hypothetical protein